MSRMAVIKMTFTQRGEFQEAVDLDNPDGASRAVEALVRILRTCCGVDPETIRFHVIEQDR